MNRKITCKNNEGMAATFGSSFSPYLLADCDGIYTVINKVGISDNTMNDGATYQGTVVSKRNIVLTLKDKSNHRLNRYQLYQLFPPDTKGTLIYSEDGVDRVIDYYVEKIDPDSIDKVRTATVSLICPDPFFRATSDITLTMAGWESGFKFIHAFTAEGETFGARINEKLKTIENYSGAKGIGLTIEIIANGAVHNPSITQVETGNFIKVGTLAHPMNMVSGDVLTITTETNNKKVMLTHEGVTTEINEYLDEESEFIQLIAGINTIGYAAESGEAYMTVKLTYREKYLGV
ncbi:Phage tail protein [Butyrivibrio hungatei DSM 14810]|uniref:Phage tail protein n=1 Tax=Butyrivibrio hungatei DSM 14810 TaxID=1121132 RepID=A0A1M7SMF2_9FIRM|nr:phage tail domain-containing protein [Butyrivibrio hungatei]SHN59646.1 Phage tail protein [Butyrivibrio hungatei DSM 14810]